MQVVYSGGSTPTPSPRVQRKQYYGRPLLAGYGQGTSTPPHLQHRCASRERKEPTSPSDSSIRDCIPALTKPVAILCLVLNIFLPGLGTFVAGLTVLCGSAIRFKYISKQKVVWSNTWVAFLQFITAFLFLLGWIWSIVWGAAFISIANEYAKKCQKPTPTPMGQGETIMLKESENGMNVSLGFNRTSSTPGLSSTSQVHLNKPLMLRSSSADQPTQPTIVLQTVPPSSHSESSLIHKRIHNDSIQRQTRKLNAHTSEESCVSGSTGKADRLEQIVLHNLPRAPGRRVRGVLRRDDTITSTTSTVSEEAMII